MARESTQEAPLPHPRPLTDAQRKLIKATVPILAQFGGDITRRFYQSMLEAQPDLNNIFSHSKQTVRPLPRFSSVLGLTQRARLDTKLTHSRTRSSLTRPTLTTSPRSCLS